MSLGRPEPEPEFIKEGVTVRENWRVTKTDPERARTLGVRDPVPRVEWNRRCGNRCGSRGRVQGRVVWLLYSESCPYVLIRISSLRGRSSRIDGK